MRVAFFDFDHTLLNGDSNMLWYAYLLDAGLISSADWARHERFMWDYGQGTLDFSALQDFRQRVDAALAPELLRAHRHAFAVSRLLPQLSALLKDRVRYHHQRGDRLAIVSATRRCLIEEAAWALGIPALITAEPERLINGLSCFAEGKVAHVEAWLAARGWSLPSLAESWFYSDSHNDLPLLLAVSHPVAVAPDDMLRLHAGQRGWPVIARAEAVLEAQY
ncbi:hypothetical protein BI347_07470 [Chromobacterium sphagni]|uniref:Phosphoserine phosphatase n=1 Tax=Chromobacterium sphagni TaxID=1903179 RepID=A0A1S1X2F2_9NEIS|nr:HAD-IB family phosphatase [Chromobacterium sphagni]OHX13366.1 hypothetical protein BI347_07470 [Chromobacterium sphagni]